MRSQGQSRLALPLPDRSWSAMSGHSDLGRRTARFDPIATLAARVRGVRCLIRQRTLGPLSMQGQKSGGPDPKRSSPVRRSDGAGRRCVVSGSSGEIAPQARQDRRPDRAARTIHRLPAGRGGGAAVVLRRDPAPDRPLARTARCGGQTGANHGAAGCEGRTMRRGSARVTIAAEPACGLASEGPFPQQGSPRQTQ